MKRISSALLVLAVVIAAAISFPLAGCAGRFKPIEPVLFRHCSLVRQADGSNGCDCLNPKIVRELDARTGKYRKVAYCDGKF